MENIRKSFTTSVDIKIARDFNNIAIGLKKKPAALLREFIEGIVENRVRIAPPKKIDSKIHYQVYS